MPRRVHALSTLVLAILVVWVLAPRGQGSASLQGRSRVTGWALFVQPHADSAVVVAAGQERSDGVTLFVRARLRPAPELLIGSRVLLGDEMADGSAHRVIVPRRLIPAVDLVSGARKECAVSFTVSRVTRPREAHGVICGVPFGRADAVAADVQRTTTVRDASFFH